MQRDKFSRGGENGGGSSRSETPISRGGPFRRFLWPTVTIGSASALLVYLYWRPILTGLSVFLAGWALHRHWRGSQGRGQFWSRTMPRWIVALAALRFSSRAGR